jgi:chorismate mutase
VEILSCRGDNKSRYTEIPKTCVAEMPVEGSLVRYIRILVLENKGQDRMKGLCIWKDQKIKTVPFGLVQSSHQRNWWLYN